MSSLFLRRVIALKPQNLRMSTQNYADPIPEEKPSHVPVMVNEVIEHLDLKKGNVFLDMTFGAGGHSKALLERIPELQVLALDRDPLSQTFAKNLEKSYPGQVTPLEGKFSDLPELFKYTDFGFNSIDGILFDLGCSSMQFDYAERGFSVNKDGPLDMRMDGDRVPGQLTAAEVLAFASESDLINIFKIYGEEKKAVKIARAVIQARNNKWGIKTTKNLVELIECIPSSQRTDKLGRITNIATKIFQALRIFINNEINELNYGLLLAHKYLKVGGRAVVISFHSLEDKIVKKHFKGELTENVRGPLPLVYVNVSKNLDDDIKDFKRDLWTPINKNVIVPSAEEVSVNPRSRSAKLRAAIKI